jgi:hypothetical protein
VIRSRAKPSRSLERDAEEWSGMDRVGAGSTPDPSREPQARPGHLV